MNHAAIRVRVNRERHEATVPVRLTLLDFLRDELGLTGTHAGCEHGVCGCCNVLLDGRAVRSCLLFAVQADEAVIVTVEGLRGEREGGGAERVPGALAFWELSGGEGAATLHPLQRAFVEHHALQCGYCTPGMLITAYDLLTRNPHPTEDEIREALAGNLCRCTGYVQIIEAIAAAARAMAAEDSP